MWIWTKIYGNAERLNFAPKTAEEKKKKRGICEFGQKSSKKHHKSVSYMETRPEKADGEGPEAPSRL